MSDLYLHAPVHEELLVMETAKFKIKISKSCNVKPWVSGCCCQLFAVLLIYYLYHNTCCHFHQGLAMRFGHLVWNWNVGHLVQKSWRTGDSISRAWKQVQGPSVGDPVACRGLASPAVTTPKLSSGACGVESTGFPLGDR